MNELRDVMRFLAELPGFEVLDENQLAAAAKGIRVAYFRGGDTVLAPGDTNASLRIVRTGAIELRDSAGALVQQAAEGEFFGLHSLVNATPVRNSAIALEDSLVYELDGDVVTRLRRASGAFDSYCIDSLADRLLEATKEARIDTSLSTPLKRLITRPPVSVPPTTTVRSAAEHMTTERVSCLLVTDADELVGIVTDRDLRTRVVAAGLDVNGPLSSIMTARPVTVGADDTLHQAALEMLDRNVHHLPVMERGSVVGLITRSDFMKLETEHPLYVVGAIARQDSPAGVATECERLPRLLLAQVEAGSSARQISRFITAVNDSATRRLIQLAESELGTPPLAFAWIALGSQGRLEQSASSDQDNAIVLHDAAGAVGHGYFQKLAAIVNDGLDACGFPYCPGEVMARNAHWCQPLRTWREYFRRWISEPEEQALMHANIFFDLRLVHGDASLVEPLHADIRQRARDNTIFLSLMAKNALSFRPPLGFFRQFVLERSGEHRDTLDLKKQGILPIVEIARIRSLAAGEVAQGTRERLRLAAARGEIAVTDADSLCEAMDLVERLRLEHQAGQLRRGLQPDNHLAPAGLSRLSRQNLKAAFAQIRVSQAALANRFHVA